MIDTSIENPVDFAIFFLKWGFVAFIVLWIAFVNYATWFRKYKKTAKKNAFYYTVYIPLASLFAAGYLLDILFNWIWGSVFFWELPREATLSERLKRTLVQRDPSTKRFKLAHFTCLKLIEPWWPNHCGLEDL